MLSTDLTFMRIASVDGEEPYSSTMKLIRIAGFKHGINVPMPPLRPSAGVNSTLRRSYCEHGDFTVFKGLDITSAKIFNLCTRAAIVSDIAIYMCRSDASGSALNSGDFVPTPFLSIVMSNAIIAGFNYEMNSGWPVERVDIRYTSISWLLDWVNPVDGTASNQGGVGWNGGTNAPTPPYAASSGIPSTVAFTPPTW